MEAADFSGWATKANLRCSDGRTIMAGAFAHQDQTQVPLVWQHAHNEPANVLGHAILENRPEGVYCHGFFNSNPSALSAKELVQHEDIQSLSIYANRLVENNGAVSHGQIREVSLVLAGANPGATIDHVNIHHAEGYDEELPDEAIIRMRIPLEHADIEPDVSDDVDDTEEDDIQHADDKTVQDVFDTLNPEQKNVVLFMLGKALETETDEEDADVSHADDGDKTVSDVFETFSEDQKKVVYFLIAEAVDQAETDAAHADDDNDGTHAAHADDQEGSLMTNVFEGNDQDTQKVKELTHNELAILLKDSAKGPSFKESLAEQAELKHGIQDINVLFPDAKAVGGPEFLARRQDWVARVMDGTHHTPFSRIKSLAANLTLPDARAKGYIKGNVKQEEFFRVSRRITNPQTIYKKQKLDRDDIVDITDFDVVAWLKAEMRLMLEEEISRAILIGDGRSGGDEEKISEDNVRSIANDNDFYVTTINVNLGDASSSHEEIVDALVLNRRHYRGSGNPDFFCSEGLLAQMLLIKDTQGRRIYPDVNALAAAIRVREIITVEVMDEPSQEVLGIMVNLNDYNVGADRGGAVALFDDFDIDYNQQKYLIETRISGALIKPKSALVVRRTASNATLVVPVAPTWNAGAHSVTVATTSGVTYKNKDTGATLVTGTPIVLSAGQELTVIGVPTDSSKYVANTANDEFLFTYSDGQIGNF